MSEHNSVTVCYRLDISYIGTAYYGFQSQPHGNTIQDFFEKALGVFIKKQIRVTAASRTDTEVHAEHQVLTFRVSEPLDDFKLLKALNALLPRDIRVRSVRKMDQDFHPTRDSVGKIYCYRIWRSFGESPFLTPYTWKVTSPLNVQMMQEASASLVGTHDFSSFCAKDSSAKTKVRTIHEIQFFEDGPLIEVWISGSGFLKQMVRTIVGTLVDVGLGKEPPSQVQEILAAKNRDHAGLTAPGYGLSLIKVLYDEIPPLDILRDRRRSGYNLEDGFGHLN